METFGNQNMLKLCSKYYCEKCEYKTDKKSSYKNHLLSAKHIKETDGYPIMPKICPDYNCEKCNKIYSNRSGLWKHKKTCKITESNNEMDSHSNNEMDSHSIKTQPTDKDLIMLLIKENSEFKNMVIEQQNMMMEVIKNGTHNTTHTNSHNKSFNLQFFLNETCKDAMNIMDFVESIQLQLSDLEKVGEVGFVEGISNIIVKNLKALDVTQRPVHCTDKKREVLYVKDEDKWEKQDEENVKLRKVIKKVTDKNMRLIPKYREKYPDCNKSISRYSDQYNKIIVESMGGSGDNDHEKASKIIKNISKQVIVEKETD